MRVKRILWGNRKSIFSVPPFYFSLLVLALTFLQIFPSFAVKKVNLNQASAKDLEKIPGIGRTLAQRIVEYRKVHGVFSSLEELLNIKGIGLKKLKVLKKYLYTRPLKGCSDNKNKGSFNETTVYYFVDDEGIVHFTQFPEKVPPKYRKSLKLWHP